MLKKIPPQKHSKHFSKGQRENAKTRSCTVIHGLRSKLGENTVKKINSFKLFCAFSFLKTNGYLKFLC